MNTRFTIKKEWLEKAGKYTALTFTYLSPFMFIHVATFMNGRDTFIAVWYAIAWVSVIVTAYKTSVNWRFYPWLVVSILFFCMGLFIFDFA